MLNFFILFVQQCALICSHPRPLQHTLPQYTGLDVHLSNMPQLQTCSSTLTTKAAQLRCALCVFLRKASFRPLPLVLKSNYIQIQCNLTDIYLSVCLYIFLSIFVIYLPIHLSIFLSIYLSIYASIYSYLYPIDPIFPFYPYYLLYQSHLTFAYLI